MLAHLYTRLQMLKQDSGEGPVPYVIMVAIITGVAVVVGGFILMVANEWLLDIERP